MSGVLCCKGLTHKPAGFENAVYAKCGLAFGHEGACAKVSPPPPQPDGLGDAYARKMIVMGTLRGKFPTHDTALEEIIRLRELNERNKAAFDSMKRKATRLASDAGKAKDNWIDELFKAFWEA